MGLFSGSKTRGDVMWGDVKIPHDLSMYHFLAAGTTGSGKSTLIRLLQRGVLPDVLDKSLDTRALIYDAKSEVYPDLSSLGLHAVGLKPHSIILNPFDSRCSAWDIGRDIRDASQAQELAAVMVPPGEGANKYFYDASRLMIRTAAHALAKLKNTDWSLRDLLLACSNVADLKVLVERAELPGIEAVEDFLNPSREARSVRMTLAVENSSFNVIAAAWELARKAGRTFSIHDWVEGKGPQVLVIGASKSARTALNTINRLVIQRVNQITLDYAAKNEKSGRRTWVFLDEFASLGAIPNLEELLTEGRSRGICAVLGFQHIAHVRRWYGQIADALLGQCLHQAYFRSNDSAMAEWCARHFGLLISMDNDPNEPAHIKKTSPAATMNDFLFLEPATAKMGLECIVRSSKAALPNGPRKIQVRPQRELSEVGELDSTDPQTARFIPWDTKLELKPWTTEERKMLCLPDIAAKGESTPIPENDNPVLIRSSQINPA